MQQRHEVLQLIAAAVSCAMAAPAPPGTRLRLLACLQMHCTLAGVQGCAGTLAEVSQNLHVCECVCGGAPDEEGMRDKEEGASGTQLARCEDHV